LLGVIAIRLAVLVVVGWTLTLLPRQAHDDEAACFPSPATRGEAQATPTSSRQASDPAFDDMLRHD
jgi:hypothetical protein